MTTSPSKLVAIIGAGVSGLVRCLYTHTTHNNSPPHKKACARRCMQDGLDVLLLERSVSEPNGAAFLKFVGDRPNSSFGCVFFFCLCFCWFSFAHVFACV